MERKIHDNSTDRNLLNIVKLYLHYCRMEKQKANAEHDNQGKKSISTEIGEAKQTRKKNGID